MAMQTNAKSTNQNLSKKWDKILWDFEIKMDHPLLTRRPNLVLINKKKETCHLVDFVILVEYSIKIKESEKIDKYLDLIRVLKMLRSPKVTVIPILAEMFVMGPKWLEKRLRELEIRGRIKTVQITVLLKSVQILWRNLRTFAVTQTREKLPVKNGVKNLHSIKMIMM